MNGPTGHPAAAVISHCPRYPLAATISGTSRRIPHPPQGASQQAAARADCSLLSRPRGAQVSELSDEEWHLARVVASGRQASIAQFWRASRALLAPGGTADGLVLGGVWTWSRVPAGWCAAGR